MTRKGFSGLLRGLAIGRLGRDPEVRESQTGRLWLSGSIAISDGDETLWLDIVAFNGLVDQLRNAKKGDMLTLEGRLAPNTFRRKDGTEVEKVKLIVDRVPPGRRRASPPGRPPKGKPEEPAGLPPEPDAEGFLNEESPF